MGQDVLDGFLEFAGILDAAGVHADRLGHRRKIRIGQ